MPAERLIATLTDSNFRIRSLIVAEHKAKQAAAPVYMYSFEWETPVQGGRLKAPHALDVPFTFDTIDLTNATDRSEAAHRAGGDDVGHLGGICSYRRARACFDSALAGL